MHCRSKSDKLLLAFDMMSSQYKKTLVAASNPGSSTLVLALATTCTSASETENGNIYASSISSLSRYETFRFFRNFLVSLFTLCGCHLQLDNLEHSDNLRKSTHIIRTQEKLLDGVTMYVTDNLMEFVEQKQRATTGAKNSHVRVSFDDIAEWYSGEGTGSGFKNGHEVMAWLELLDINKWIKLIS